MIGVKRENHTGWKVLLIFFVFCFFSCPEQLNRWPCPLLGLLVGPAPLTIRVFKTLQSDPRDLWSLRHLIRVMRRQDLTQKNLPTYIPTHPPTYLWPWPWPCNSVTWTVCVTLWHGLGNLVQTLSDIMIVKNIFIYTILFTFFVFFSAPAVDF